MRRGLPATSNRPIAARGGGGAKQRDREATLKTDSMQPFIIVTAANAEYFELVKGALLSIREKRAGQNAVIGFFDLGCTAEQLQWLKHHVDIIRQTEWEFEFPGREEAPQHLKGLVARPFLPRYFPDFE